MKQCQNGAINALLDLIRGYDKLGTSVNVDFAMGMFAIQSFVVVVIAHLADKTCWWLMFKLIFSMF